MEIGTLRRLNLELDGFELSFGLGPYRKVDLREKIGDLQLLKLVLLSFNLEEVPFSLLLCFIVRLLFLSVCCSRADLGRPRI